MTQPFIVHNAMDTQVRPRASTRRTRRQFVQSGLAGFVSLASPAFVGAVRQGDVDARVGSAEGKAPPKTIDWHNHWFSPGVVAILKKRDAPPRIVETDQGGLTFISGSGHGDGKAQSPTVRSLLLAPAFTDIDVRLHHLDRVGIDHQVISWPTTLGADAILTPDEARPLWTTYNDELSELVSRHPDRFIGLAALPTSDITWAAQELERAHRELGLIGAVVPVGAFQTLEGASRLRPIFDVAQHFRSHIYLHTGPASPTIPGQRNLQFAGDDAPDIRAALETPNTFAQGAITLTQTRFLDPYPDVSVQIAMMGGLTPFLAAALAQRATIGYGSANPGAAAIDPITRLRRVYIDASTSRAPGTLEVAVRNIGPDRILFGSDFPLVTTDTVVAAVRRARISEIDRNRIFVDNGRMLLASKV